MFPAKPPENPACFLETYSPHDIRIQGYAFNQFLWACSTYRWFHTLYHSLSCTRMHASMFSGFGLMGELINFNDTELFVNQGGGFKNLARYHICFVWILFHCISLLLLHKSFEWNWSLCYTLETTIVRYSIMYIVNFLQFILVLFWTSYGMSLTPTPPKWIQNKFQ